MPKPRRKPATQPKITVTRYPTHLLLEWVGAVPTGGNNPSGSWIARYRKEKLVKTLAWSYFLKLRPFPPGPYRMIIQRHSYARVDRHNVTAQAKHIIDGIALALGVDDNEIEVQPIPPIIHGPAALVITLLAGQPQEQHDTDTH